MNSQQLNQDLQRVKSAAPGLALCDDGRISEILLELAAQTMSAEAEILAANGKDLARMDESDPKYDRLLLNHERLEAIAGDLRNVAALPSPVGEVLEQRKLDSGLELSKVRVPIGVIAVIFESRPDALVQISCLCLKSGNSVLLKGGSEALHTNRALADIITTATSNSGIPAGWIQLLETRDDVREMLALDQTIDLIIPRGSNEFVQYIMNNSSIPVLGHADGICHVFVDDAADIDMAVKVTVDSKTQYVAVCNAAETLLVHSQIAASFLPPLAAALSQNAVELRGCSRTADIIQVQPATGEDWKTEYLDAILSIKIVDSLDEAVDHINAYGSGHTDAIITENSAHAGHFMSLVDSGNVFWNCSTRFADGFRYGLGAEVGISTNKIHARGPVGLDGLLIYKWKLIGQGQTVAEYNGTKKFTHRRINHTCPL